MSELEDGVVFGEGGVEVCVVRVSEFEVKMNGMFPAVKRFVRG